MVARIVECVAELRLELIRLVMVETGEKLPPILPIVLYRGNGKWTASKILNSIHIGLPEPLAVSDTKEEFVLIDIHRLAQESLESEKTVSSIFFRMERGLNFSELLPILREVCRYFKGDHYNEIKRVFLDWCKLVAMPRYKIDKKFVPDTLTLEEFSGMSYQYADAAEEEYYTQWLRDIEEIVKRDFYNKNKDIIKK